MQTVGVVSLLVLFLILALPGAAAAQEVPYPEALEEASLALTALDEPIDDALLLGNGDLNGLLFAEDGDLVLRVTKNDVWDARLETELDPPLPTLARIKELAFGDWPDREWVLPKGSDWEGPDSYHAHPYPCPRACAVVRIRGAAQGPLTAKLDIRRARAHVYTDAGNAQCFVAGDANVAVFEAGTAAVLEPIVPEDLPAPETGETDGVAWVSQKIPGDGDWPGMTFAVACASEGGRAVVSVVSSEEASAPLEAALANVTGYLAREAGEATRAHEAVWDAFWSRSGIRIAENMLERLWYRNLYFLRCVAKEGVVSPGLFAGLLDDQPAWHGDYHTNYNIQQTYWGVYASNHCEMAEPYDRLITDYMPRARWLAGQVFGMEGAYIPHVLFAYEPRNPEQCVNPNGRQYFHHVWGFTQGVAGFSVQPLWWRYKYQPDADYLREVAYPAVRGVAVFYAEFLGQCERTQDGRVVLAPTVSPEHHGWTREFARNRDCAFCIAYYHALFDAAIEGARQLGVDADLVERWLAAKNQLPEYPVLEVEGAGRLVVDVADAPPRTYNIPVPATPVFPADQVAWFSGDAERALFTRTIGHLENNGNNATVMLAVARARMDMPDAYDWLRTELERRERRNGTLSLNRLEPRHRFNDFGHYTEMFGAVMPITELMLQSVGDVVRVFPAWPGQRPAEFKDLRAQGGFLVSASQEDGVVTALTVHSTAGGELRVMNPWKRAEIQRESGGTWEAAESDSERILHIPTEPGQSFVFRQAAG